MRRSIANILLFASAPILLVFSAVFLHAHVQSRCFSLTWMFFEPRFPTSTSSALIAIDAGSHQDAVTLNILRNAYSIPRTEMFVAPNSLGFVAAERPASTPVISSRFIVRLNFDVDHSSTLATTLPYVDLIAFSMLGVVSGFTGRRLSRAKSKGFSIKLSSMVDKMAVSQENSRVEERM
jgi:hypothetical protein